VLIVFTGQYFLANQLSVVIGVALYYITKTSYPNNIKPGWKCLQVTNTLTCRRTKKLCTTLLSHFSF